MTPYYADDRVALYHGDCLEVHAWLAADVLVTDPPYGIGWSSHGGGTVRKERKKPGIPNDSGTATRDHALSLWGDGRPSIVFGSFRSPTPKDVKQTLIWKKPVDAGVIGSTLGYRNDTELIYLRGPHIQRPPSRSSVLESLCGTRRYNPSSGGHGHPHAKHIAIMEQLIEWTGGIVADPFAGSGATLIAARNLGRRAVGVEIDERYCELIATRLAQGCLEFGDAS